MNVWWDGQVIDQDGSSIDSLSRCNVAIDSNPGPTLGVMFVTTPIYLFTLVMVVVVCGVLFDIGNAFSRSCSSPRLVFFFPGGGELRRIPVLRWFERFDLSSVPRPVIRREARRIDCRISH
jgi:hypothetical protein